MRLAWVLFVVVSALVIAAGVITIFSLAPDLAPLPDLYFETGRGGLYRLTELRGGTWVAGFVTARDPAERRQALEHMAALAEHLPERTSLVAFMTHEHAGVDGDRMIGPWQALYGERQAIIELATEGFGFERAAAEGFGARRNLVLLASVDRALRVRSRHEIAAPSGDRAWESVVSDARFLLAIDSRPLLHAALNASSAILLSLGFLFIRQKRVAAHLTCMVLAAVVTGVFLGSYLYYHYHVGSMPFRGEGWARPVYFAVLISHTVLAAFVAPLAASLFYLAARRNFDRHKRIARWALPVWLYVSVTGVLIYFMLYVWFAGV